jgi:hypothetical protein
VPILNLRHGTFRENEATFRHLANICLANLSPNI